MKNKDSPNLYEILRSASRTSTDTAPSEARPAAPSGEPHEPTLQERLAIYKAAKMGLAAPSTREAAEPTSTPSPVTIPDAVQASPAAPATAPSGPGERVLKITYNTAAFAVLVAVGLLFIAYSLGVRAGRSGAAPPEHLAVSPAPPASSAPTASSGGAPTVPAPAPPKVFTLRLAEWPYRTAQERLKANAAAAEAKKLLARAGLTAAETVQVTRGSEPRLVLRLGRYGDPSSAQARSILADVQKVRNQNQTPFAQAQFEEVSPP